MVTTVKYDEINHNSFKLNIVDHNTIIADIATDFDDADILKDIMECVEGTASRTIKSGKVASIPYIGCVRRNPVMYAINEHGEDLKELRTTVTKSEYKVAVKKIVLTYSVKQKQVDRQKLILLKTKRMFKKRYDELYVLMGKGYADFFIESKMMFEYVPYDEEVQKAYDRLNNL